MIGVNKKELNIISSILFLVISIISFFLQLKFHKDVYLGVDIRIFLIIISSAFLHELLHYVAFMSIGRVKPIIERDNSSVLPYSKTTKEISVKKFAYILLLPNLILSIISIFLVVISLNLFSSFILALVVSMGTGDYILTRKLVKLDKNTMLINNRECFGVEIKK